MSNAYCVGHHTLGSLRTKSRVYFSFKEKNVYVWVQFSAVVNPFCTALKCVLNSWEQAYWAADMQPIKKDKDQNNLNANKMIKRHRIHMMI